MLPSGAIHQNLGCANTLRTPAHCALMPCVASGFGVSGTRIQIQAATANVRTASPTNKVRQCT
jgi:hypothetical protein